VHVDRDDQSAKFWLAPVSLARNLGFGAQELNKIQRLVQKSEAELVEAWNEYHGT
jgi:predicted nucleotidyltransferase